MTRAPIGGRDGWLEVTCDTEVSMVPAATLRNLVSAVSELVEGREVDRHDLLRAQAALKDARLVIDLPAEHIGTCFFEGTADGTWVGSRFEWVCPACGSEHDVEVSSWD